MFDKTIGKGHFGLVKLGFNKQTGQKVAIKVISKKEISDDSDIEKQYFELEILKTINHRSVAKLIEVFDTLEYTFIVMEHLEMTLY